MIKNIFESKQIEASAPCRIDMGGTLDISTFYYPLRHLHPCTFNIAIGLRTKVTLSPYERGMVKVSSRGFESVEYPIDEVPFNHPLGLMFAVAAYFRAEGVHIQIASSSPPRSALGGSSVAAVALIAALMKSEVRSQKSEVRSQKIAMLAHALESSVAGVPCGIQDQLAAVYGGVNLWHWRAEGEGAIFEREIISSDSLEKHLLLAYCGIPHESKNINQRWINQFLSGKNRNLWAEIISCTQKFADSLKKGDYKTAAELMNKETAIRKNMTPDVLDEIGDELVRTAVEYDCGARFTGAGGGGCIWGIGEIEKIDILKEIWKEILLKREGACLLDVKIDSEGLISRVTLR